MFAILIMLIRNDTNASEALVPYAGKSKTFNEQGPKLMTCVRA